MDKTVIIDFNGTLCRFEFPDVGPPEENVREALCSLKNMGFKIMIHSCRTATYWTDQNKEHHIQAIVKFMRENDIPYDGIILDMDKPVADLYIDDRAIGYRGSWKDVMREVAERLAR